MNRPEQALVTAPEPAAASEATQVAAEPADAATAATGGWRGKRLGYHPSWRDASQAVLCDAEDGEPVAILTPARAGVTAEPMAEHFARLHNAVLDRSAALPRERLASRWAELQADKEQLGRTVEWLTERLRQEFVAATLRGEQPVPGWEEGKDGA